MVLSRIDTVEAILSDWRDTGAGNYHNRIFGPFLGDDDDGDDEFPLVTQFTRCLFRGKAKAFPKLWTLSSSLSTRVSDPALFWAPRPWGLFILYVYPRAVFWIPNICKECLRKEIQKSSIGCDNPMLALQCIIVKSSLDLHISHIICYSNP